MSNLLGKCNVMGDAFKKPMGPCIKPKRRLTEGHQGSLYFEPKRRLSEGHRGSLYEAQEKAWYGWLGFRVVSPGNHTLGSNLTKEILCTKPNRRLWGT